MPCLFPKMYKVEQRPRSSTVHRFTSGSSKQVVDLMYLCLAQRPILHRKGILLHLLGRLEVRDRNGCAASRRNPGQYSALKVDLSEARFLKMGIKTPDMLELFYMA